MNTFRSPLLIALYLLATTALPAQHSIARLWNEKVLDAISGDFARPTIHARNLFHTSVAMYDAWAVYNPNADTYLLGKTVHGFTCPYHRVPAPSNVQAAQEEAISFAVYRLLQHRFANSPGADAIFPVIDALMDSLGYKKANSSLNYKRGSAEMGNYIAYNIIAYGMQDGSNEVEDYANNYYKPANPPMIIQSPGNPSASDMNRWQPLQFTNFIDQSGNATPNAIPKFISAEWGNVTPFALLPSDAVTRQRGGHDYHIYRDPGPPARFDTSVNAGLLDEYKWNHVLVAVWSALLDPQDMKMVDISPASVGNTTQYPTDLAGLRDFYNFYDGGDSGAGRAINPTTGQPYAPQIVPRGDYYRVLAEFWADGPRSVTPPGHWFEILNYVNEQPTLVRRIRGSGQLCDPLEWAVKAYFALGGAMHDAAISAWSIKGWYDSMRPVSAIRAMAERGQCSDPSQPNFSAAGLPLLPGYIEVIKTGDLLAGSASQFIGQVKLKAWRGPNFINNPMNDVAGVGWIRAKEWWPYQRPTFVTPPFAGYVSGHSTYSRAAAEVLTAFTGDPFFPGGMGTFFCPKNEYLVFEDGPGQDITLQWATYRDASDQCSLSRIYGGIHPPMDDIPGRLIGMEIGTAATNFAEKYFTKTSLPDSTYAFRIFPNPTKSVVQFEMDHEGALPIKLFAADGRLVLSSNLIFEGNQALLDLTTYGSGIYILTGMLGDRRFEEKIVKL